MDHFLISLVKRWTTFKSPFIEVDHLLISLVKRWSTFFYKDIQLFLKILSILDTFGPKSPGWTGGPHLFARDYSFLYKIWTFWTQISMDTVVLSFFTKHLYKKLYIYSFVKKDRTTVSIETWVQKVQNLYKKLYSFVKKDRTTSITGRLTGGPLIKILTKKHQNHVVITLH